MQGHKESGNSSQTENLRKANRLSIHQTLRETIYSSTTENESIQLQEELTQEKITLQSKEGVRKLEQPKPKESIHSLVKKFSQLFHDKKQQTLYNLLALVKMVPHIKISKTIKWFSAQGISWLFDLVREEEYQGKALWLLMNNQEEESHYSIWMENGAVKLFLQLLKSQNFEIIQLSLEGLLRLTKCKLDFCNQFIIYQGVQRISKLIHNFHQKEIKQMDIFNKSYQLLAKICEYSEKFEADTTRQILREFFFGFYQQILPDDNVYNCYRAIAKNLKPSDNEIIQGVPDFKGIIFNNLLYVGEQQLQIVKTMFESQVPFAKNFSFLPLIQLVKPSLYHNSQRWLDSENETQKMAASVLFYMTNGSPQQLHELLSDKEFIPKMLQKKIFQRRSTYGNTTVREFFQTFIINCEPQLIYRYYTHHHVIQMLYGILYMNKQNLVKTALLMLQDILQYDEKYRPNILEILEIPQISSFASQFKYVFAQGSQYLPQVFKQRIDELRNSNTPNGVLFNKLINRYIQLIDDPLL